MEVLNTEISILGLILTHRDAYYAVKSRLAIAQSENVPHTFGHQSGVVIYMCV